MNAPSRRVVVTGVGSVSPIGLGAAETWKSACEGHSGVGPITLFDVTDCPVKIAGEVKGFDFGRPVGPFYPRVKTPDAVPVTVAVGAKDAKKMGRFIHLSLAASLEAYGDSGLDGLRDQISPERMGSNIGVGMGGLGEIENVHRDLLEKGYRRITPFFIPQVIANLAAGQLSILLDLKGPNLSTVTACASSSHAIGEAFRQIQRGEVDIMFAGGAEAVVTPLAVGGFAAMRALSTRNDAPQEASRPFDAARDGFVIAEGATTLVLEELESAKRRGAKIYAEVAGYGASADAHHMTTPAPGGEGGFRAMKLALEDSGLRKEDVGYVNCHGTSTPAGDQEEAQAVARLFPDHRKHLHVSSTKSMTGHMLGAAGATEALFAILSIRDGIIPPTINLKDLDPACAETGLNFTANVAARKNYRAALSNSFGFGGTNASLIFKSYS